jgi:hypothetical protein
MSSSFIKVVNPPSCAAGVFPFMVSVLFTLANDPDDRKLEELLGPLFAANCNNCFKSTTSYETNKFGLAMQNTNGGNIVNGTIGT